MQIDSDFPQKTSILLMDGGTKQRIYWAEQLTLCSTIYEIFEAPNGQSGLALYRSRWIDCVVLELGLRAGPRHSKPMRRAAAGRGPAR